MPLKYIKKKRGRKGKSKGGQALVKPVEELSDTRKA